MPDRTLRGIRGATSVERDTAEAVLAATRELLEEVRRRNGLDPADIVSVFFTTTPDLTAVYPALAARQLGWTDVPLLGAVEMNVPGAPARIVRVLVHWLTDLPREQIVHVYLKEAIVLRPDWVQQPTGQRLPEGGEDDG